MRLPPLLRKELAWSRRQVAVLLLVLVLFPAALVSATSAFGDVVPRDTPVAVVPQGEDVSRDDVAVARGAATLFAEPVTFDDRDAAFHALEREQVYAVLTVPPDLGGDPATVGLYVDGSVVPYLQPSAAVVSLLGDSLPAGVSVERTVVGPERSLSAYLVPTFQLVLVALVAMAYLPHVLASERAAFDRLRVESTLERVLATKLAVFTGLMAVPLGVFAVSAGWYGYGVDVAALGAVAVYLLTFLTLAALSAAVTLATDFATWGRLCNLGGFLFVLLFSGLFYPAGFFSGTRRELVRLLPTHYAVVAVRGYTLRGASLGTYADWLLGLAAVAAVAVGLLGLAVRRYEGVA
mgnify:CR=1 FL=1